VADHGAKTNTQPFSEKNHGTLLSELKTTQQAISKGAEESAVQNSRLKKDYRTENQHCLMAACGSSGERGLGGVHQLCVGADGKET